MNKTEELLNIFIGAWPNSGHQNDEIRFKDFIICSFNEGKIYTNDELKEKLLNNEYNIFTEEQVRNLVNKSEDYIELLSQYKFRENNLWNFNITHN